MHVKTAIYYRRLTDRFRCGDAVPCILAMATP